MGYPHVSSQSLPRAQKAQRPEGVVWRRFDLFAILQHAQQSWWTVLNIIL